MWITTQHAADTTAVVVAATGAPLTAETLDAAENVAESLTAAGLPLGTPAAFASTILAAQRAVRAGTLTH